MGGFTYPAPYRADRTQMASRRVDVPISINNPVGIIEVWLDRPVRGLVILQCVNAASPTWVIEQGSDYAVLTERVTPVPGADITRVEVAGAYLRVSVELAVAPATCIAVYGGQSS